MVGPDSRYTPRVAPYIKQETRMRLTLSIFPPALIVWRSPSSPNKWGKAVGPVVILPSDAPAHLKAHELLHVWQWLSVSVLALPLVWLYLYIDGLPMQLIGLAFFVDSALRWLCMPYVFRTEAAGYAVSVRHQPDDINRFAVALSSSAYNTGKTAIECKALILARVADGRWF
jgi:hypothetical protein